MPGGNGAVNNDMAFAARALQHAGIQPPSADSQLGKILFFSGGSALKGISREFVATGIRASYVISTFDSGGSTAELRRAFHMPALGDLRLRLSCLSSNLFFEHRLKHNSSAELYEIIASAELEQPLAERLALFLKLKPANFNLAGAALGNLALAADYLSSGRCLYESVQRLAALLGAKGEVLPVSEDSLHLGVRLLNGKIILGQHRFTGKYGNDLDSPIAEMFFFSNIGSDQPLRANIARGVKESITESALICYPIGSFYSSLLANLQVDGVGQAIMDSQAKKLYMPNPGPDKESLGLSLKGQLEAICKAVSGGKNPDGIIDFLLVDPQNGKYLGGIPSAWCRKHNVKIIDFNHLQVEPSGFIRLAPHKIVAILQLLAVSA